jgi:tetratricopeptide (TPR) repeat protein
MPRDDWYRHSMWSAAEQQDFFARLKRSRTAANKAQYVRIQASCLADAGHHRAAVELLDLLFRDFPERFELAQSHLQKALCLIELNEPERAITEFRASLQSQREYPNVGTTCWLRFPWFIVRQQLADLYDEALAVLEEFRSDTRLAFPVDRYRFAAVRALIAQARNDIESAREFAKVAIQCATAQHSGFRYHPDIGLVDKLDADVHNRLTALLGVSNG